MEELLKNLKETFINNWGKLSKTQKIIVGSSAGSFFVFLIVFTLLTTRTELEPLFNNLDVSEAGKITQKLDEMNVNYVLENDGSTISVDKDRKYNLRLALANEGIIDTGTSLGFGIFDERDITQTQFDKEINLLRAIEGELQNTIRSLKSVQNAEVTITPQHRSPFLSEKESAKAAVVLHLTQFTDITTENVKGIMLLVASGVEGLNGEDVVVIDDLGRILSLDVDFGEGFSKVSDMEQLRIARERDLEKKAVQMLSSLGSPENYRVQVSIELDFDKQIVDKEEFETPSAGGRALSEGLVVSKQEESEKYVGGTSDSPEGVAGTSSNIPGYVGVEDEERDKVYERASNLTNYEINKIQTSYEKALGSTRKLNVSVLLNTKSSTFDDVEFDDNLRTEFESIIKASVGFNAERGDIINVSAIPFDDQIQTMRAQEEEALQSQRRMIITSAIALSVIIFLTAVTLIIVRKIEQHKLREKEKRAVEEYIPEFEETTMGDQLTVEEQERKEKESSIKDIAKQKPEDVAQLIRSWLLEE